MWEDNILGFLEGFLGVGVGGEMGNKEAVNGSWLQTLHLLLVGYYQDEIESAKVILICKVYFNNGNDGGIYVWCSWIPKKVVPHVDTVDACTSVLDICKATW